ncbi:MULTISPECIES: hypothetical protein [Klebsiella]|uniref:hypothetical protein n=1 Tax=Klebsiella TaxID=570 RepID=UPI0007CC1056|nr:MULTISPECIES: hypothetical protein [Klebsiella]EKV7326439.1 hypothetical protein [Klebsiella pneumoniae]ELA0580683.1 hypothetical protein [Klebsiella pneumoniae]MBE3275877.1 hypothetical protein [Klebsiella pneumoniae]MBL4499708.1 hypothetical protein [Klebsiella pneumoniae]MBL4520045.1 hypothetical protein [Klebsiella pneumoniae]
MNYKILFKGKINGKDHTLDTIVSSTSVPEENSPIVRAAAMRALADLIDGKEKTVTIEVSITAVLPL